MPRIALCHLESLVGLPAVNLLFDKLRGQIDVVILSNRFGQRHGGVLRQLLEGARRSGLHFTFWLGLDIICAQVAARLVRPLAAAFRLRPNLYSVRALAAKHDALVVETGDVNSDRIIQLLRDRKIDVVVVMNFDQILGQKFIGAPRFGIVNVHPSLLPAFRGPTPAFWALFEGKADAGVSLHVIDSTEIDAGPILVQEQVPIDKGTTVAWLTMILFLRGASLLETAISELVTGPSAADRTRPEGEYRSFPRPEQVSQARDRGVRLFAIGHVLRLLFTVAGLCKSPAGSRYP